MLEVFTHRSVIRTSPNDIWGDNTRLSVLGEAVMRLIVTWCLFSKKQPMFTADQISEACSEFLTDANVDSWTNMCGLKEKVRVSQDMLPSLQAHEVGQLRLGSLSPVN
jgi:dsRNA-specific ribonuclease